jgi:hypothetical protein
MGRFNLLIAALVAFGAIWLVAKSINDKNEKAAANEPEPATVEAITRNEAISIYPEAVRVNLLIHDSPSDASRTDLTNEQRQKLESAITKRIVLRSGSVVEGANACFIPHHFFRYYDKSAKQIGEIAICFCCDGGKAKPVLLDYNQKQSVSYDIKAIKQLVSDMRLPVDVGC